MENKGMNLNITNGSKTIWVSKDGRHLKVDDIPKPYLENILCDLWNKADAIPSLDGDKAKDDYLLEYCPTYLMLRHRAMADYRGMLTGFGRPKRMVESKPVQLQLPLSNDYENLIDRIADAVAAKIKPTVKRKRK